MKTLDPNTPVGDIAAGHAQVWSVLERFGIDYCCGGRKPLREACQERGLALDEVISEIARVEGMPASGEDLTRMSLTELADYVEQTHHDYMRRQLPQLRYRLERVLAAHGDRHPEVRELQCVFEEFASELYEHMEKEERVLFPAIRELERTGEGMPLHGPVSVMEHDHQVAGYAMDVMRRLTGDYKPPQDACNTFRALYFGLEDMERDMRHHVHIENNILFPAALSRT